VRPFAVRVTRSVLGMFRRLPMSEGTGNLGPCQARRSRPSWFGRMAALTVGGYAAWARSRAQRMIRGGPSGQTCRVEPDETVTFSRPTGPGELALVEASGWMAWPPRLPEQPIFYPVVNEEYAAMIARGLERQAQWLGHVTRFRVRKKFLERYDLNQV